MRAETDQLEASSAKLTDEIADLATAIAKLEEGMTEATTVRQAETATNAQTVKDAGEAQTAAIRTLTLL